MGKDLEKQIETIKDQGKKQADALKRSKPKSIKIESNKHPITKEIYEKILEKRMDEILEMSKDIDYSSLVYDFKGSTSSISFTKFGGPMYTYDKSKNGEKRLQQVEKEQKDF